MDDEEFIEYRKILDMSMRELADLLDVNESTVSRWEAGLRPISYLVAAGIIHLLNEHLELECLEFRPAH